MLSACADGDEQVNSRGSSGVRVRSLPENPVGLFNEVALTVLLDYYSNEDSYMENVRYPGRPSTCHLCSVY
jgi:hypothetical protein